MFEKVDLEYVLRAGIIPSFDRYPNLEKYYQNDASRDESITKNIFTPGGRLGEFSNYNSQNIFSLAKIKNLCIEYNLRFLDASLFKGTIPQEAINKIKFIEDQTLQEFENFKIIAPARRFELEDENADPLLFVNLGNDQFLFIHKWGNDMAWYKKIISIPSRNYISLALTAITVSLLFSLTIPNAWLTTFGDINYLNFYRVLFFFWLSLVSLSLTSFFWFSFRNNVSSDAWNKNTF